MKRAALISVAILALACPATASSPGGQPFELTEATIYQLQGALHTHRLSSEQLVQLYLNRIAAYDDAGPNLNAFIHVNANALQEAHARDLDRANHPCTSEPLYGIPVLLKDNIDTADMPTTAGSVALEGFVPPSDAFITQKLRNAGAIILGKGTLTEYANFIAIGMPSGYSSLGGYGLNAYDPRPQPGSDGRPVLTPGGSSSGPGIAVSANLVTIAVGTETSGSILSPATANMVVGIKPTLGLVSRTGILPITANQDTAGPLARTVSDAALLLGVLAGFDPHDPATSACLTPGNCLSDYTRFLHVHNLPIARIAVPRVPYWTGFSAAQQQVMLDAIADLRDGGAFVADPYEIPNQADISAFGICTSFPAPSNCSTVLMYGQKFDLNNYLAAHPLAPVHTLGEIIAFNNDHAAVALKYGQAIFLAADQLDTSAGSADTARFMADRARDLLLTRGGLDAVFNGPDGMPGTADDFDAILFPQNRGAAAPAKAGYPSIGVPAGFIPPVGDIVNPIPFGVAFTGRPFSEGKLISLAYAFEQRTHHRQQPASAPPLAGETIGP